MRELCGAVLSIWIAAVAGAQTFRDPMRPAGAASATPRAAAPAVLRLEGVISGAERVAIVSGRVVRVGDQVLGATILEIFPAGVRCSRAGKVLTLTLPAEPVIGTVRVARTDEAKASEAKQP